MTALYMAVTDSGVIMMSDGVTTGSNNDIVNGFEQKQLVRADCNIVLSTTGTGRLVSFIDSMFSIHDVFDFDSDTAIMPELLRKGIDGLGKHNEGFGPQYSGMLYGGYSQSAGAFVGYIMSSYEVNIGQEQPLVPFEPRRVSIYAKPDPTPEALREVGLGGDLVEALQTEGPFNFGVKLMHAIRRSPYELHGPGTVLGFGVGGFLQSTFLERDRASTAILHRWPDEIGRVIDPSADQEFMITPAPLVDDPAFANGRSAGSDNADKAVSRV